jgi:3-oxoacyl-[acyl-carrier-protein] synthase II
LNASAGYAAIELDVRGPNVCVAEHEASGEVALATALDLLASGMCDVACVAGADEIGAVQLDALSDLRLLNPDAGPTEAVGGRRRGRRGRMGGVLPGEGAAALVLERADAAAKRGARSYAGVAGARVGAVAEDRSPYGFPHDPDAAAAVLLDLASFPGPAIDGVVGGANGLVLRDALDAAVLRRLRGNGRPVGYAPFRRLVGDWGSAGALGALLASLALDAGQLPGMAPERQAVTAPKRLLLIGAARGGVLVPVVLDRTENPPRCSSTASPSSDSSASS